MRDETENIECEKFNIEGFQGKIYRNILKPFYSFTKKFT